MRLILLLATLLATAPAWSLSTAEYLPPDADPDPAIPTPEAVLGWQIADWRITHDQLVRYMEVLAASSDRVSFKVVGRSHEQRPVVQLIFTSLANQGRIEALRQRHLASALGELDDEAPLVLWMGHSIHGNEASGSNAAPLLAYYLAASRSEFVTQLLEDSVILLDPSFNPDGMQRFSAWANSNRSLNPVSDRNARIHNEAWPQNRTNHYLFDLNRDWMPLVHPVSRARIAEYQRWLPHVLTDQHESGRDAGYFFQPGVPTRQNPLLPPETLEITRALGDYHARAMDEAGELYYAESDFDDFYIGKGSTYTDINGTVGILFEQPRINGPVVERDYQPLTFANAVANQLRTSISTMRGSFELQQRLKRYQNDFFRTMASRASKAGFAAWIIGDDGDHARATALLDVFARHEIEYSVLDENTVAGGYDFKAGHAWVIPANQRQFGLLQGMMETRTEFQDETFYDVSAWTMPHAYNLPYATVKRLPKTTSKPATPKAGMLNAEAVSWLVPWHQLEAPRLLQSLLDAGARVRVAIKPFTARTANGRVALGAGTLSIHPSIQAPASKQEVHSLLGQAVESGLTVHSAISGLTPEGPDLGDGDFHFVKPIRTLLVTGNGASSYAAGEVWHQLDQRLGFAPVMVETHRLGHVQLADYTHVIMADGEFASLGASHRKQLQTWVSEGGILVASGRATDWVEKLCFGDEESCNIETDEEEEAAADYRAYGEFENDRVQRIVGGAIFMTELDLTHPLAFGYARKDLPVFRQGTTVLERSKNAYANPARFTQDPLVAGFIGAERLDEIRGQPAIVAERQGRGLVVRFGANPLFRGFWRGTERLFVNSLYFGQIVEKTQIPD